MARTWDDGFSDYVSVTSMATLPIGQIAKANLALRRVTSETGTYEVPLTPIDQPLRLVLQRKPVSDIYANTGIQKNYQLPNKEGSDLTLSLWATGKDTDTSDSSTLPWFNNYGVSVTFHKVPMSYLDTDSSMNSTFTDMLMCLLGTIATVAAPASESDPDEQVFDVMKLARGILSPEAYQS